MDETGRWRDNIFIERLWRSLKYEEVYLHAYETVSDAHQRVTRYMVLASHGIALEGSSKMDTRLFHAWSVGYNTPAHTVHLGALFRMEFLLNVSLRRTLFVPRLHKRTRTE